MATSFHATTQIIDGAAYFQADTLREHEVPNPRINMEIFRSLPPYRQELICPDIDMRSRGAWAMDMAYRLCRMAKIDDLLFLSGSAKSPAVRFIPILADDEDGDGDGPRYFYSWLRSVQQVIKSALTLRQQVLHAVDNFD